jgi:hypothetical protein
MTPYFSFDHLNILGVFKHLVQLEGKIQADEGDDEQEGRCIIFLTRTLLTRALKCWLDDKRRYCEIFKECCGAEGRCQASKFKEIKNKTFWFNDYVPDDEKAIM